MKIRLESPVKRTFRTEQISGIFDLGKRESVVAEWDVDLPLAGFDWKIGLIVGPSGSGKTTIARHCFKDAKYHAGYDWPEEDSIVDAFPADVGADRIVEALSSVGFSSPPHWLKRYAHLSNGQKFRCELARLLLSEKGTVLFDEFTSVVDRDVAKISSLAVQKAIRRQDGINMVAMSCHYDVIDWLDPDWIFNTTTGEFSRRSLRRRPAIELSIHKADRHCWPMFREHHYLSDTLSKTAKIFVAFWRGHPVGMVSSIHTISKNPLMKAHRIVVLPDYQGAGIGVAMTEWLGAYWKKNGKRFLLATSHPAFSRSMQRSKKWKLARFGHSGKQLGNKTAKSKYVHERLDASSALGRITACFEYVGPAVASIGCESSQFEQQVSLASESDT